MNQNNELAAFRKSLSIYQFKNKIIQIITDNKFTVITGDTGSGKSTQLPQYILDSPQIQAEIKKNIESYKQKNSHFKFHGLRVVTTQPRRIAAVSMAMRICRQRNAKLGEQVGYAIRFDDKTTSKTKLKYVTDGIFIRQCINDPNLQKYSAVILDEAHERSLYTDILFALIKKAVQQRMGTLKLIVTSATLNTKIFSNYFDNCPVLQMHGKIFPVEVKYGPVLSNARVEDAVKAAIRMHLHQGPGDILAFLTGSQQCEFAKRLCYSKLQQLIQKGKEVPGMVIYALYGAQSNDDQARVFQKTPQGFRKLVFSTNIAETSLTIDNIGYVIDCGYVKQKCFNPRTNMDSLVTVPISKVQAIQRKGRAGRTQAGKCYRMYSQKFYQEMKDFTTPQILRVSLTNVILTLKSMKVKDVINFQYMQNPNRESIFKALSQLYLLEALDQNGTITELGYEMSKFPLEPPFSKALITSLIMKCQEDLITLVSVLSSENIWRRIVKINQEEYETLLQKQRSFFHTDGDHQTLINVFKKWSIHSAPNNFCQQNLLSSRSLRQAENIKLQLFELCANCSLKSCKKFYKNDQMYKDYKLIRHEGSRDQIKAFKSQLTRRCLVTGFFYNTARKMYNEDEYLLIYPEGTIVGMDPLSVFSLNEVYPEVVLFTQLASNAYGIYRGVMRTISRISLDWIKSYIPRTKNIDMFRLAGIVFQAKQQVYFKDNQEKEEKEQQKIRQHQTKMKEAKQRYDLRKKIKME